MEKDPERRFESCTEFADALRRPAAAPIQIIEKAADPLETMEQGPVVTMQPLQDGAADSRPALDASDIAPRT